MILLNKLIWPGTSSYKFNPPLEVDGLSLVHLKVEYLGGMSARWTLEKVNGEFVMKLRPVEDMKEQLNG